MLSLSFSIYADEPEKTSPITNKEITRNVSRLDIEGKSYENVTIQMCGIQGDVLSWPKVKVKVKNSKGKKVWSKTFKNAYIYVFSDGQLQIGLKNFNQMMIFKLKDSNEWIGIVNEKEGIY